MDADKLVKEQQATLEAVNALAREFGFGQGELDDDLAGCLRQAFRLENEACKKIATDESERLTYSQCKLVAVKIAAAIGRRSMP